MLILTFKVIEVAYHLMEEMFCWRDMAEGGVAANGVTNGDGSLAFAMKRFEQASGNFFY